MEEDKEMKRFFRRFEWSSLFLVLIPLITALLILITIEIGFDGFWPYLTSGLALMTIASAYPSWKLRTNSLEILKLRREQKE